MASARTTNGNPKQGRFAPEPTPPMLSAVFISEPRSRFVRGFRKETSQQATRADCLSSEDEERVKPKESNPLGKGTQAGAVLLRRTGKRQRLAGRLSTALKQGETCDG